MRERGDNSLSPTHAYMPTRKSKNEKIRSAGHITWMQERARKSTPYHNLARGDAPSRRMLFASPLALTCRLPRKT